MNFMNLKALSYEFGELMYQPVKTDGQYLCDPAFDYNRRKEHGALGKAS
jgi:hypothetical protein